MTNQTNPTSSEPVALQIYRGELCYKSKGDDQSFGMWCPITSAAAHSFEEGTKFYTHPTPTLSDAELGQVLEALRSAHRKSMEYGLSVKLITNAIALLEKAKSWKIL